MTNHETEIRNALTKYEALLRSQLERVERINTAGDAVDYTKLDKITIGVCGGDGIGPIITDASAKVLEYLLADDVKRGRIVFKHIDGLTMRTALRICRRSPTTLWQS